MHNLVIHKRKKYIILSSYNMSAWVFRIERERGDFFIKKNDTMIDKYPSSGRKEALVTIVQVIVIKKDTSLRSELTFVRVVWAQIWPASTTKDIPRI